MHEPSPPSSPPPLSVRGAHVFVQDLRLNARVGVDAGERDVEQPLMADIWVGVEDPEQPARSERLGDALDYVAVARTARRVVEERHWPLLESLAFRMARAVLARPGASWVRVRLRKPGAIRQTSAAGVEVELEQEGSDERPALLTPAQVSDPEEVAVIGGGVAGMAAALWCWRFGHPCLLVDAGPELGGQLHLVHGMMPDLAGLEPLSGPALAARLRRQLARRGVRWLRDRVAEVRVQEGLPRVRLASGFELRASTLVVALGLRRRKLGIPGEEELVGRGLLETAARHTAELGGKRVVVIGGGDAACENALSLARLGAKVTLVHRRPRLSARRQFARQVDGADGLTVLTGRRPLRFLGEQRLEGVVLQGPDGEELLPAEAALVRIGWVPNREALPPAWCDERGYLRAGPDGRVEGERAVFGAGDLLGRLCPSVATAVGSAAVAARAAVDLLEAGVSSG